MRIVVSGGGTAGHVSPVLATVAALQTQAKDLDVVYIGTRGGMEAGLVKAAGLRFKAVLGGKLRRQPGAGIWRNLTDIPTLALNLRDLLLIGIGTLQSLWLLARLRPAAVFNKMGPAGLPVGLAAATLRIPMILHEPDVIPGWGNRLIGRWAQAIAVGFPATHHRGLPQAKLVQTGTPVQPIMLKADRQAARHHFGFNPELPVVLVVGGSQGAQALNTAVVAVAPWLQQRAQLQVVAGRYDAERVKRELAAHPHCRVDEFLPATEMAQAYAAADIVVCRAGASTLAELAAWRKPVVVAPNRQAAAHQLANAHALEAAEAGLVVREDPKELEAALSRLLASAELRERLAHNLARFYHADAADRIAALILAAGSSR